MPGHAVNFSEQVSASQLAKKRFRQRMEILLVLWLLFAAEMSQQETRTRGGCCPVLDVYSGATESCWAWICRHSTSPVNQVHRPECQCTVKLVVQQDLVPVGARPTCCLLARGIYPSSSILCVSDCDSCQLTPTTCRMPLCVHCNAISSSRPWEWPGHTGLWGATQAALWLFLFVTSHNLCVYYQSQHGHTHPTELLFSCYCRFSLKAWLIMYKTNVFYVYYHHHSTHRYISLSCHDTIVIKLPNNSM